MPKGIYKRTKLSPKRNGKYVECNYCGKKIYRAQWQLKKFKSYCSQQCVIEDCFKNKIPWNKGLKGYNSDYPRNKKWRERISNSLKGEKNYKWIKDSKKVSYIGIHQWLLREFGRASKCENKNCDNKSKVYDWSLLRGKKYERKRENFWQLCRKCHIAYDKSNR